MSFDFHVNEKRREINERAYNVGYNRGYSTPCMGFSEMDDWSVDKHNLGVELYETLEYLETYQDGWFYGRRKWAEDNILKGSRK